MKHEEFMKKLQELKRRMAKAKDVEELKAIQEEIRAVLAAPRT